MRWGVWGVAIALTAACYGAGRRPARPRAATAAQPLSTIEEFTAAPSAVQFRSEDPDAPPAPLPITLNWRARKGDITAQWSVTVRAASSSFTECSGVPLSAVRVACSSVTGFGSDGSAGCSPSFSLSGAPQQLAGGNDRPGTKQYSLVLLLSFVDSWRYKGALASPCSLDLVYTLDYP